MYCKLYQSVGQISGLVFINLYKVSLWPMKPEASWLSENVRPALDTDEDKVVTTDYVHLPQYIIQSLMWNLTSDHL